MNKKEPNAFAVYPDAVKMDLATKNSLSAIFAYEHIAKLFAHELWPNTNIVTPIYSTHFDPDFKEQEFTAGQEVEVSNDGIEWLPRFYIGTSMNGFFVAEEVYGINPVYSIVSSWAYCRLIKEQVTYYVYMDIGMKITNQKNMAEYYGIIHSFTI